MKEGLTRLFSCLGSVVKKDCMCHSSCCCGDCETDILEHDPPPSPVAEAKKRQLPKPGISQHKLRRQTKNNNATIQTNSERE